MEPVIYAWALSFIISSAPVTNQQFYPHAKESVEDGTARRESIAHDVVDVIYTDETLPVLFSGPEARAHEVPLVLSIMFHESGFRRDVDLGIGPAARGDGGRSWCMMQIQVGAGRTAPWNKVKKRFAKGTYKTVVTEGVPTRVWSGPDPKEEIEDGWTGPELVKDRKKCITAGFRIVSASFGATNGLPLLDRLRVYASGSRTLGGEESAKRVGKAVRWFSAHRPPMNDTEVREALTAPPVVVPKVAPPEADGRSAFLGWEPSFR